MASTLAISIFLARAKRRRRDGESYFGFFVRDIQGGKKKRKKLRKKVGRGLDADLLSEDEQDFRNVPGRPGKSDRSRSSRKSKSSKSSRSRARSKSVRRSSKKDDESLEENKSSKSRARSKSRTRARSKSARRNRKDDDDSDDNPSRRQLV